MMTSVMTFRFIRRVVLLGAGIMLLSAQTNGAMVEPALHRSTLTLAPSDPQIQTLPSFDPRWYLPEPIALELTARLKQANFHPSLADELVRRFSVPTVNGVRSAIPDRALLARFTAAEREAWLTLLAHHYANVTTRWPLSLGPAELDALDAEPRWKEATFRMRATGSFHNDRLIFSDLFALEDAFATTEDRQDFFRLVLSSDALLLKLRRQRDHPLDARSQAAWWQSNGRYRAIEPLLNAIAAIPNAPRLDVAHLLPRLPRALLNTFPPDLGRSEDPGIESSLLASDFFSLTPGADPQETGGLKDWLARECRPVTGTPQYGDLFVYGNLDQTPWPFAAVYIADGIGLARRPTLLGPWQFLDLAEVGRLNPRFADRAPRIFRPNSANHGPDEPPFLPDRMPEAWRKKLQLKPLPAGPWGRLWYYEVLLAPSGDTLEVLPAPEPTPVWTFSGLTQAQLLGAVATAPMSEEVRRELNTLFAQARPDAAGQISVRPTLEFVLATPPEFRTTVFPHLVGGLSVADYAQHLPFPTGFDVAEWFDTGSLPESVRAAILRLVYPAGNRVMLSDFGALFRLLDTRLEKLSAHRAALREPAVVVLMEKPRPEEVPALAEYWRHTGRAKSTARLLESFAATGDDLRYLDIVHLLSPIERELLNSYHVPANDEPAPSCYWTAFNFGADEPDPRFLVPLGFTRGAEDVAEKELRENCDPIPAPSQLGDIICYRRKDTSAVLHVCTFLADGLVLTKNGFNFSKPWCLSLLPDIDELYLNDPRVERVAIRRRDTH